MGAARLHDQEKRILVVDDDAAIRTMMERVLHHERFHVDVACDGFEAIEKLSSNDYDTIVLDLAMPRIDGIGVLRYIENLRPDIGKKVILVTANLPVVPEAATALPVAAVLTKPFDIRTLVSEIRAQSPG